MNLPKAVLDMFANAMAAAELATGGGVVVSIFSNDNPRYNSLADLPSIVSVLGTSADGRDDAYLVADDHGHLKPISGLDKSAPIGRISLPLTSWGVDRGIA